MCGITGLVFSDSSRKIDRNMLQKMTDSIIHRGPDDEGFYINNNIGLGFRRLSIIDLKSGHQPMGDITNNYHIIFNGEIYNYEEKRKLLLSKGYTFKTNSDTEVLLNLYIEFGRDCLEHLRGMFSFVIYDKVKHILFCARDRFGIKPFYYFFDTNKFIFGSEIKTILSSELIKTTMSMEALDSYFAYGYITKGLSIYNEIKKMQPSNYLLLDINRWQINISKYWEINYNLNYNLTEDNWVEQIDEKFNESIKLHMVSDVPIGSFLSGGIDSSAVTAFMAKNSKDPIKTFSIGFDKEDFNELPFAQKIAVKYKTEHFEEILKTDSIDILPEIIKGFDEPFADSSAIPTYYVSKFASKNVKVILSGDGGDELFAGYNLYDKMLLLKKYNLPCPKINKLVWGSINKLTPELSNLNRLSYFLSKNKFLIGAYNGIFTQADRNKLFNQPIINEINHNFIEKYSENIISDFLKYDFLTAMQSLNINVYMVDDILTKVDRMSMLNSLEVRVPILDHVFAELIFTIPSELKLNHKVKKYIFKKMLNKYLPNDIIEHKKQGFAVPLDSWFTKDLKEYLFDKFIEKEAKIYNYLEKNYIKKIITTHSKQGINLSAHIWSLIVFEEWLNKN